MPSPNFIVLYVNDPAHSAAFYARLLERPAVEASPTFAMFALESGVMLGLWARATVLPAATGTAGAAEVAWSVDNKDQVDALHRSWLRDELPIAQAPTQQDFGYTFVALDPDGHRLRVFAPGPA